ncbi:MAG: exodeoxyribonuclease III [Gammaproteobacteria bacterium]
MRVLSFNFNGIRSATRKGFFDWFLKQNIDIACFQETKAQLHQLQDDPIYFPESYHCHFHDALKKGYSGVAIYSKQKPLRVQDKLGFNIADTEGRYIQVDFPKFSVISLYLPSGTSGDERQTIKYQFMDAFYKILNTWVQDKTREYIICGDWNIAHKPIDLTNWKANQKESGFLPEERSWLDKVFGQLGWVDAFRILNTLPEQYTWWSMRSKTARAKNVGWRIDYQIVTPGLKNKLISTSITKDPYFSDHAPLLLDYAIES